MAGNLLIRWLKKKKILNSACLGLDMIQVRATTASLKTIDKHLINLHPSPSELKNAGA